MRSARAGERRGEQPRIARTSSNFFALPVTNVIDFLGICDIVNESTAAARITMKKRRKSVNLMRRVPSINDVRPSPTVRRSTPRPVQT